MTKKPVPSFLLVTLLLLTVFICALGVIIFSGSKIAYIIFGLSFMFLVAWIFSFSSFKLFGIILEKAKINALTINTER